MICPRSKRWWDGELTAQAKVVRRAGRGGKRRRLVGGRDRREADSCKVEATKMKALIRRKKEACWRKFCEESGDKNPWEVVRWARDPFRLGKRMGVLRDAAGTQLASNQEKVDGFVCDIFGREEGGVKPNWEREYPEWPLRAGTLEDMVLTSIRGTSNKSAAGPDGIGYRLIKLVLGTRLGRKLVALIVDHLQKGLIPEKCKEMKMVMIPKPGRDLTQTKNWRPINLINCMSENRKDVPWHPGRQTAWTHGTSFRLT